MANSAFVKPINILVTSSSRVPEQIKGRLLLIYEESLKGGKEKCMAIIVDKHSTRPLKSVLVLEPWSPGDISHMRKHLDPLLTQVVSLTNARIAPRGKTLVFYDSAINCSWDTKTKVEAAEDDSEYPMDFPALPAMQAATSVKSACMIAIVEAITEAGTAQERNMAAGGTKLVAKLKVAIGNATITAAFWESLVQQLGASTVGQVCRIGWATLKPEGGGKYSLGSVTATTVALQEGDLAAGVSENLAQSGAMVNMYTSYSLSFQDKMKKHPSTGNLWALETIESMHLASHGTMLAPAVYVCDARGMTAYIPSRAWYTGCIQCKKQLDAIGSKERRSYFCPEHGENRGNFDITPQVTPEGCLEVYRATSHAMFDGSAVVVPACCQNVMVDSLRQLIVSDKSATQAVESTKRMVTLLEHPVLEVLDSIDGIKVSLNCKCLVCGSPCTLFAAGLPKSVADYTRMSTNVNFVAFVQLVEPDSGMPIGYHVELKGDERLPFELRVFKYQAAQFLLTFAKSNAAPSEEANNSGKGAKALEDLMADVRPDVKPLRLTKTMAVASNGEAYQLTDT